MLKKPIESIIMMSRWIVAPMYLGLIVCLAIYCLKFLLQLFDLAIHFKDITESDLLIVALGLVDITMIANLIVMIVIGSYSIFIRRIEFDKMGSDKPQGFAGLNSGMLKVKMGLSLIGVSSIHLLKVFVNAKEIEWDNLWKLITIHMVFVIATLVQAYVDRLIHPISKETEHH